MDKRTKTLIVILVLLAICVALTGCVGTRASAERGVVSLPGQNWAPSNEEVVPTGYKISFVTNTKNKTIEDMYALSLSALPDLQDKDNPGYSFRGWYKTATFKGYPVVKGEKLDGDVTLYAKWVPSEAKKISTVEELISLVNGDPSGKFILTNNIDLSQFKRYKQDSDKTYMYDTPRTTDGVETEEDKKYNARHENAWIPLCGGVGEAFSGTFDGNGYTLYGLNILISSEDQDEEFNYLPVGLFGKVTGTITNVNIAANPDGSDGDKNAVHNTIQIDGDCSRFYVGAIAGWVAEGGQIKNSIVSSTAIINPEIEYESTIWDSLFGSYATPTENTYFGGIAGLVEDATISGCSSEGIMMSESNADNVYMGGIVGYVKTAEDNDVKARVTACSSSMSVKGRYAGGLVGYNNGNVTSCFAMGKVEGSLSYPAIAGGLVSYNYTRGEISRSYADGDVRARTAGGLVGVNVFDYATADGGTIRDTYASGDVYASEYAGGLIGRAVAQMPVEGRDGFSPKIFDYKEDKSTSKNKFFMIERCLAYGNVEANATKTTFKDYTGKEYAPDIYYAVYAGSLIGQAYEPLVKGCVGFGTVMGISNRPKTISADGKTAYLYNSAYVENFVGQSSSSVNGQDYIDVYVAESVVVTRYSNNDGFVPFNNVEVVNNDILNGDSFYRRLGFDLTEIWNVRGIDVAAGIRPTININIM